MCIPLFIVILILASDGSAPPAGPRQGVPAATVSALSGDVYAEQITDDRGLAVLQGCQGHPAHLAVEFGSIRLTRTLLVKSPATSAFASFEMKLSRVYLPVAGKDATVKPLSQ